MAEDKRMTLAEAIARFVPDGASVVMGAQMEQMIPFAAGHELIRQRRRELTLIGPISDALFDQLIGAGCVARVLAAWVGNVSEGLGYCLRRAIERGLPRPVEMVDFSNFTLALALHAAALGVPFLPARTALGSDLLHHNPYLKVMECPFEHRPLVAVQALHPDVAIVHVQRADVAGNAHLWGGLGVAVDAARAARAVIVIAEEIVPAEVIASDPNRTLIPGILVHAVVHEPWGAHPSPVQGYYGRDHQFFAEYYRASRYEGTFQRWLEQWVFAPGGRTDYLDRLGAGRLASLTVAQHAYSAPADFGW